MPSSPAHLIGLSCRSLSLVPTTVCCSLGALLDPVAASIGSLRSPASRPTPLSALSSRLPPPPLPPLHPTPNTFVIVGFHSDDPRSHRSKALDSSSCLRSFAGGGRARWAASRQRHSPLRRRPFFEDIIHERREARDCADVLVRARRPLAISH
eukprot:scaffold204447_cov38-Tisochrysis_lutea.AAC.2